MDWRAYGELLKLPICYLPFALVGLAACRHALVGRGMERAALRRSSHPQVAGVARTVLSFRTVVARNVGLRRVPGVLRAADAHVVGGRHGSQPFAEGPREPMHAACSSRTTSTKARSSRCAPWRWSIRSSAAWHEGDLAGVGAGCISVGFIGTMAFVIVSRTAMVTMPIMLAVFALIHLKWRTSLMIFGVLVA